MLVTVTPGSRVAGLLPSLKTFLLRITFLVQEYIQIHFLCVLCLGTYNPSGYYYSAIVIKNQAVQLGNSYGKAIVQHYNHTILLLHIEHTETWRYVPTTAWAASACRRMSRAGRAEQTAIVPRWCGGLDSELGSRGRDSLRRREVRCSKWHSTQQPLRDWDPQEPFHLTSTLCTSCHMGDTGEHGQHDSNFQMRERGRERDFRIRETTWRWPDITSCQWHGWQTRSTRKRELAYSWERERMEHLAVNCFPPPLFVLVHKQCMLNHVHQHQPQHTEQAHSHGATVGTHG